MTDDEVFFQERGFGLRIGFGERPALLIVDMVKAFTDPDRMLGTNLDTQIQAIRLLIASARRSATPIYFSTARYDDPELRDAGIWRLKQKGAATLRADTDGHELDPRLDFLSSDSLLVKKYASCFFGTDLVSRLVSQKIDTIIVAGCTTSGCVRASVVDALQNGFRPMIVSEAVGDRSASAHE